VVARLTHSIHISLLWCSILLACAFSNAATAAPFAAFVMDAATGETLYSKNADTRLHPASLTKMMTLYVTFGAVESGEISLDKMITISQNAASESPSKLGLRKGQKIALRYLIRAAAIKSANDAATAIGEAIGGSEAAFTARMTKTAKMLGMKNTQFKNANGLTKSGHYSTAHDMSILGRHLFYDYPDYYHLFSRREISAGMATVRNTNRRFLNAYRGADGIKTGYTNAAGFNLTASAERGNRRIIATIFGSTSTPKRNQKMAELLNLGFKKKSSGIKVPLSEPAIVKNILMASKTRQTSLVLAKSPRPKPRPASIGGGLAKKAILLENINSALEEAAANAGLNQTDLKNLGDQSFKAPEPAFVPNTEVQLSAAQLPPENTLQYSAMVLTAQDDPSLYAPSINDLQPQVVTRMSTSGGHHFGVNVGRYPSRSVAERELLKITLAESTTLSQGLRKVLERSVGYDANVMGLTEEQASLACRRLTARAVPCKLIGVD